MNFPLIIAHRGASEVAPENTLAALRRAIEDGADGLEFDVRLSKDNVPVLFHDANLRRLSVYDEPVAKFSAAELGAIDVGSWFNERYPELANRRFTAETVPTLADTLRFLESYTGIIYVELKCRESEIRTLTRAVGEIIKHSPLLPQIIVKSFQFEAIPAVRALCPNIKTAVLFAPKIMTILRKEKRLINVAAELGAEMISVHFSLATKKLVKKAEKKNLAVTIWTADNPIWARRAYDLGVYAIITNNPARMIMKREEILADE